MCVCLFARACVCMNVCECVRVFVCVHMLCVQMCMDTYMGMSTSLSCGPSAFIYQRIILLDYFLRNFTIMLYIVFF